MTQLKMTLNPGRKKLARQLDAISQTLDFKNPTIKEYFGLACADIVNGASVLELQNTLKFYEELELYEECAGILLACEYACLFSLTRLIKHTNI